MPGFSGCHANCQLHEGSKITVSSFCSLQFWKLIRQEKLGRIIWYSVPLECRPEPVVSGTVKYLRPGRWTHSLYRINLNRTCNIINRNNNFLVVKSPHMTMEMYILYKNVNCLVLKLRSHNKGLSHNTTFNNLPFTNWLPFNFDFY